MSDRTFPDSTTIITGPFENPPQLPPDSPPPPIPQALSPLKEKYVSKFVQQKPLFKESYNLLRKISSGGFGTTFLVSKNTPKTPVYILKEISFNENTDKLLADIEDYIEESIVSKSSDSSSDSSSNSSVNSSSPSAPLNKLYKSLQMIPAVNFRNSFNLISANVEINALQHIKDNGCRNDILCYVDHFIDFRKQTVCIITEKFPKQGQLAPTLESFMAAITNNSLSVAQFITVVKNILNAFAYLHSINIFHNDIKPANILISPTDLSIHVIDFGSACLNRYCISTKSEGYFHPKANVLESGAYGRNSSKNLDIYALGIVFEQILKLVDLKTADSYPTAFLNILNFIRLMQKIDINDTTLTLQFILDNINEKPKKRLSKLFP